MEPKTLQDAIVYFSDLANCLEYLVARRWPDGVICPKCGSKNVLFLEKYNRWHCREKHDAPQFTLKTGTVMEDSPISLTKWLPAMWLLVNCRNGVSSYEIARDLKVTQKSAWFMLHRIRAAMKESNEETKLGGSGKVVQTDETFLGGDPKNFHVARRKRMKKETRETRVQMYNNTYGHKIAVQGMYDNDTRQVRAKVVPNVRRETLQAEILSYIEWGSTVHTDEGVAHKNLHEKFVHETVNHSIQYVKGNVTTNSLENFWSLLKRNLKGTYVAVEPYHLDRYLDEQVFRFNNRLRKTDADRFNKVLSQVPGRRLTYESLTGKVGASQF